MVADPEALPEVAVTVARPAPTPVTRPCWLTDTVEALLVVQVTASVMTLPSASFTTADRVFVPPTISDRTFGETVTLAATFASVAVVQLMAASRTSTDLRKVLNDM